MQHKEFIVLCLEDCSGWSNATTRRVVMQNRAGLRQFLDSFGRLEQSTAGVHSANSFSELSSGSVANDKLENKLKSDVKLNHLASGSDPATNIATNRDKAG